MNKILKDSIKDIMVKLNPREQDIILQRFGLDNQQKTLEEIGKIYNLSRERVRQIQNQALEKIIPEINNHYKINNFFKETKNLLKPLGVKKEHDFLLLIQENFNLDEVSLKIYKFISLFIEKLIFHFNDNNFHNFYAYNKKIYLAAKHTLEKLSMYFIKNADIIYQEEKIIIIAQQEIYNHFKKKVQEKEALNFIKILKNINKNPAGLWGLKNHKFISPNCLKDKIFFILNLANKPLHFKQIYQKLNELKNIANNNFDLSWYKNYSLESIKNELVKHKHNEFTFLGKGTYGLKSWDLTPGTAKELILDFIRKKKKITKTELWNYISSLRQIKKNSFYIYLKEIKKYVDYDKEYLIYHD